MAKENKTVDFNLGLIRCKKYDGSGDVIEFYRPPSAIVNALTMKQRGEVNEFEFQAVIAYYGARAAEMLPDLNIDPAMEPIDAIHKIEDSYAVMVVDLYDDGTPVEANDSDPT